MAQDLPDDVWSELAETFLEKRTLHSMSLTSRRMHLLVVPALFRDLQFHLANTDSGSLMARLIRNNVRARFLFNSPELLRHTRFFSFREDFYNTDSMAEYLAIQEGSGSPSCRSEARNFFAALYDTIYCLISRMPGLRGLHISNTVMTPLCFDAIFSRSFLTSLRLEPSRRSSFITYVTPVHPNQTLRLRDFSCYGTWTDNEYPTDPYFADILAHCILELEKLELSSNLLPSVVSCLPPHHTLPIRSLSLTFPFFSSDTQEAAALLQVLHACPHLQDLTSLGGFPDVELTNNLPPPSLPDLSSFVGPSPLLQIMSGGTNLVDIYIRGNFDMKEKSITQIILSPLTHLRKLAISQVIVSQTPHEFLRFIRSFAVFRNLERLNLNYEFELLILWKDHVSAQDSQSTIRYLLNQLPCMRSLEIHSFRAVGGYDIGCPISKESEPVDRGHPSLRSIYVDFICGRWYWDFRRGWEESDMTIP